MDRLWRRIWGMLAIGRVTMVNDTGGTQQTQLQLSALETRDATPVIAHFGFSSNAPAGSIAVAVFASGDRSKGVIVATGDAGTRPTGQSPGESIVYNAFGMSVALIMPGIIVNGGGQPIIVTNASSITLDTPLVRATGVVSVATGATGTFTTSTGLTVTVQDGIVTNID